jgi:rSAM/selenodomain-associated transferase 1
MKNKNALIIIAKHPEKENVKTRLSGSMTREKRLELYMSMLGNTINRLRTVKGTDTIIAFAPGETKSYFSSFYLQTIPLPTGDLGERMHHAFEQVFRNGYEKAALVGVDIPDLSESIVLKAYEFLTDNDIVFGPAKDGGYYLIGMKRPYIELFKGVPWSTAETLKKSIEKVKKKGLSFALTEELYDVDTEKDAKRAGF